MYKHIAALTLGTLVLASPSALAGDGWYADYDEAVKVAKKEGKDLFVDFTGSDWCGWCIRLHEEVFDFPEWSDPVQKDYVLVALDFPKREEAQAKVPNPERNEELKNKYRVRGFPTILMMTAEGEVYAQTGYEEGGPEAYLEHMKKIRESGRPLLVKAKKLVSAFEAAEGAEKVKAWEEIVTKFEGLEPGSPFADVLAEPVRWAFKTDPKNEKGLKMRAIRTLLKAGIVDEDLIDCCRELVAAFESAEGADKVKAWEEIITMIEGLEAGSPVVSVLAEPVRWALEADPKNEKGLKMRAVRTLLEVGMVDQALLDSCHQLDPKNESGLLEEAVEAQFGGVGDQETAEAAIGALDRLNALGYQNKAIGYRLNYTAARWLAGPLDDPTAAKDYAMAAKEIGTDDERMAKALDALLEELD